MQSLKTCPYAPSRKGKLFEQVEPRENALLKVGYSI